MNCTSLLKLGRLARPGFARWTSREMQIGFREMVDHAPAVSNPTESLTNFDKVRSGQVGVLDIGGTPCPPRMHTSARHPSLGDDLLGKRLRWPIGEYH